MFRIFFRFTLVGNDEVELVELSADLKVEPYARRPTTDAACVVDCGAEEPNDILFPRMI